MLTALFENAKLYLILIGISLLFFVADFYNLAEGFKSLVQFITTPIQYGVYSTGINFGRQFDFIVISKNAAKENNALKIKISEVISENAALKKKVAELEGMVEQENSLSPQTFSLVPARPIGLNESRYLLIDKGSLDGFKLNQPVIYKDNYIGKIIFLSPRQSRVLLPSDPESKIAVFVSNEEGRAKGVLIGQFGSEAIIDKILHNEPVKIGDIVYSEGTEGSLPRGLVLGKVSEVMEQSNEVFKKAKVDPIIDITNLDIVFVSTN